MRELVFFLEEPSAEAALKGVLPRLLPDGIHVRYVVFEGKQDLHKRLGPRLRAWMGEETGFVVLCDKDSGDCMKTKEELRRICERAGRPDVLIRIACQELESWFLGDLRAVEDALGIRGIAGKQGKSKYRAPDRLSNPSQELGSLTKQQYQKLGGSRKIGPRLALEGNASHSLRVFLSGVRRLVERAAE